MIETHIDRQKFKKNQKISKEAIIYKEILGKAVETLAQKIQQGLSAPTTEKTIHIRKELQKKHSEINKEDQDKEAVLAHFIIAIQKRTE